MNTTSRRLGIACVAVSVSLALGSTARARGQEVRGPSVNLLKQLVEMDGDGDGGPENRYTIADTYDQHGNPVKSILEGSWNYGGMSWTQSDGAPDAISTTTKTYDQHGNVLPQVAGDDWNADGTPDSMTTTTNTYTHRGTR